MLSLASDEKILFRARKHWFVFAIEIFFLALVALLPLSVRYFLPKFDFFALVYTLWLMGVWIIAFSVWTDFFLDVWVVTNKRIIDIEQKVFFNREIATCELSNIQDITTTVSGLIPTLLNYGNIKVQTAGEAREFMLHSAANPEEVKQKINELKGIKPLPL